MLRKLSLFVVFLSLSTGQALAADQPWGTWSLEAIPQGPGVHAGKGVTFDAKNGAHFSGEGEGISVSLPENGWQAKEFTVSCEIHTDQTVGDDFGTIVSVWDDKTRTGFHLSLRNNSGCTSSQANWRQLEFGLDAGTEPEWRDEGRPGNAVLGFALCAHAGELYAATCEAGATGQGHVYRYQSPGKWVDLGTLDGTNSVTALAAYNGSLYAATGKYRLGGSALEESTNTKLGGRIYRLEPNQTWTLVGELPDTEAVAAMTEFNGRLYASSLYKPAGLFRLEANAQWSKIATPDDKRVQAMRAHDGWLYLTSYDGGRIYRFDGEKWEDLGNLADNTQTYSLCGYQGQLWVGTWPSGRVYQWKSPEWIDRGRLGEELEVMAMGAYNGSLYAGSLPLADVYRYEGDTTWTHLKQIDTTPDVKYRRVWTMANFQGRAFYSTLPSGKIWSMSTGSCVTSDTELSPGWHRISAKCAADCLELSVDGKVVAKTTSQPVTLPVLKSPLTLKIGDGPNGTFLGKIRHLSIGE